MLITGHSLGGAVATLCAIDLARLLPEWGFATALSPASAVEDARPAASPSAAASAPAADGAGAGAAALAANVSSSSSSSSNSSSRCGDLDSPLAHSSPISISCYTFGAPRTGNHAFARDYKQAVPDSWSVINDQDLGEQYSAVQYHAVQKHAGCCCCYDRWPTLLAGSIPCTLSPHSQLRLSSPGPRCHCCPCPAVAKSAKFVLLFKRPGNVVIVNPQGDLIVNPSECGSWGEGARQPALRS